MIEIKLQANLRRERVVKLTALLVVLATAFAIVVFVRGMLISLVLAFVANYLLSPFVNLLERKGTSRQFAILIPYFCAIGALVVGVTKLTPLIASQISSLESSLPGYQRDFVSLMSKAEARFHGIFNFYGVNVSEAINAWIVTKTSELSMRIPEIASLSITVATLAPFFAFFMMRDGRRIAHNVLAMVPNDLFELALRLHHQINDQLGSFIRARFLEAAIVGAVIWIGLEIAAFQYATLLAIFAALMNLIPYVGPIIGAVPAVLIAILSPDSISAPTVSVNLIIAASAFLVAQVIDAAVIVPMLVARIVNLHPVTVVIAIIVGAEVMGVLGMMISIPVASVLKLTFTAFYEHLVEFRS